MLEERLDADPEARERTVRVKITAPVQPDPPETVTPLLRPIVRAAETMPVDRLLALLREKRSHQALVTGERGAIVGLITLEDVLTELLGGVGDELKR